MKILIGSFLALAAFVALAQSGVGGTLHTQSSDTKTKMTLECREATSSDKIKKDKSWGSKKVLICVVK